MESNVFKGIKTFLPTCYLLRQVVPSVEESITVAHIVVEASSIAEEIGGASAIVGELQEPQCPCGAGTSSLPQCPLRFDLGCRWYVTCQCCWH